MSVLKQQSCLGLLLPILVSLSSYLGVYGDVRTHIFLKAQFRQQSWLLLKQWDSSRIIGDHLKKRRLDSLLFHSLIKIFLLDFSMVLPNRDSVAVVVLSSLAPSIFVKSVLVVDYVRTQELSSQHAGDYFFLLNFCSFIVFKSVVTLWWWLNGLMVVLIWRMNFYFTSRKGLWSKNLLLVFLRLVMSIQNLIERLICCQSKVLDYPLLTSLCGIQGEFSCRFQYYYICLILWSFPKVCWGFLNCSLAIWSSICFVIIVENQFWVFFFKCPLT